MTALLGYHHGRPATTPAPRRIARTGEAPASLVMARASLWTGSIVASLGLWVAAGFLVLRAVN